MKARKEKPKMYCEHCKEEIMAIGVHCENAGGKYRIPCSITRGFATNVLLHNHCINPYIKKLDEHFEKLKKNPQ